jgi:hypothetical protein
MLPLVWGATPDEHARPYPADAMVDGPVLRMTRAVRVDAAPDLVWRWLCQMEVGPYSYDWIDNRGRRSPRELSPGVVDPAVGQRIQVFRVTDVERGHHWSGLTIPKVFGRTAVTYAVEADGAGSRLVCRITTSQRGPVAWGSSRVLAWGDLVMMRKQLLTFQELAERDARRDV